MGPTVEEEVENCKLMPDELTPMRRSVRAESAVLPYPSGNQYDQSIRWPLNLQAGYKTWSIVVAHYC